MDERFVSFRDRREGRRVNRFAISLITVGFLALFLVSGVYAGGQSEGKKSATDLKPVSLTYASFAAADSMYSKAFLYVANKMTKETNGRVTFRANYSGSLVGFNDMIAALQDGRADITIFLPVQDPHKFPLSTVGSVPFVADNTWANSEAFNEMYKSDPQFGAEWKSQKIVPLWFTSLGPAILGTREPANNPGWLNGKSIRSTGYLTQALQAVGANPVAIPNADVYQALQRGVIQGFYAADLDGAAIDNRNFEVTSHWYDLGAGEYAILVTAISQSALDKLTKAEQTMLLDAFTEVRKVFWTDYYYPIEKHACDLAFQGGLRSMEIWPKAEADKFRQIGAPVVRDQWIKDVKSQGIDQSEAQAFFDKYVQTVKKFETNVAAPFQKMATELRAQQFSAAGR